nr:glycosyltransferase [uncultured Rhodoferax sp.]
MTKSHVGIYRTAFPLYSETFIVEQIGAYSQYEPVIVCRDLYNSVDKYDVVTLSQRGQRLKKLVFSLFGGSRVFDNEDVLKKLGLIHAHFAPDAVLALSLAKRLKIPLVATCHGSDIMVSDRYLLKSMRLTNWRYLTVRPRLMRETSFFIAVSDFLRNAMIQRGFPAEKVIRHYVGVDTERLVPNPGQVTAHGGERFILSVARHTDVKGIDVLLRAFAHVVRTHPDVRLLQIGAGELTQDLKALAAELDIEKNIDFLGAQQPSEVLKYLQACKMLVLSSRKAKSGAEESFGLVLIEAAACGVPTIGTRVGGIPEAIVHGETGFVVESENVDVLAERISLLLTDKDLAMAMGMRGREMVCDSFDIKVQTRKLEAMYASLL